MLVVCRLCVRYVWARCWVGSVMYGLCVGFVLVSCGLVAGSLLVSCWFGVGGVIG